MEICKICETAHGPMVNNNIIYDKDGNLVDVDEICPHCRKHNLFCKCSDRQLWGWFNQWWRHEPTMAQSLAKGRVSNYTETRKRRKA